MPDFMWLVGDEFSNTIVGVFVAPVRLVQTIVIFDSRPGYALTSRLCSKASTWNILQSSIKLGRRRIQIAAQILSITSAKTKRSRHRDLQCSYGGVRAEMNGS